MSSPVDQSPVLPALEHLFPEGVACTISRELPADFVLLPPEQVSARRMSPRRYAEFLHGRACARQALSALGIPDVAIPVGTHREPCWPAGIVGSISHGGGVACAVVGWQTRFAALGVDIEPADQLEPSLASRICRPEESGQLQTSASAGLLAKVVFCVKESVYKCVWPLCGTFLDFHDVEVRLDRATQTFAVISHNLAFPDSLAEQVVGHFEVTDAFVVAGAAILRT